jgi:hypothetical protein
MPTTLSKSPLTSSTLAKHTAGLDLKMRSFLAGLCARPQLHARFLNTVSLLEHIGSRKIMISQSKGALGDGVLKHLAEEARHASIFRRFAVRLAGRELNYDATDALAPASAKMFFGRLDSGISRAIAPANDWLSYLYVTTIIELRAMWLYGLYEEVLKENNVPVSLGGVIAEEDGHLAEMATALREADPFFEARIERFCALECHLFDRLFAQLQLATQ